MKLKLKKNIFSVAEKLHNSQIGCSWQLIVASCQLVAASCQLIVVSWQLVVASCQLVVASCQLLVVSWQLVVGSWQLLVASCQLLVVSGQLVLLVVSCQLVVGSCQLVVAEGGFHNDTHRDRNQIYIQNRFDNLYISCKQVPTSIFINKGKYTCTHFKSILFVSMALTCECRHLIKTCSQVLSFITGRPAHSMILSPLVLGNSSPLHICDTAEHCRIYNISSYSREVLLYTQIWYFMTQVMWQ